MAFDINININARDKATATIAKMSGSVSSSLSALSVTAGNLAAQGLSMAIAEIRSFAREALDMGGKLTDASAKTGIAAEDLQIFWDACKMGGIAADEFNGFIIKMNRNLGSGAATGALKELGVSFADLNGKNPAEQFKLIGAALANVPSQAQKTKLAMDIFGKGSASIFAVLGKSSAEFSANLADSAKNVRPMSSAVVAALDELGDSLDRAKGNAVAFAGTILAYSAAAIQGALAPALDDAGKKTSWFGDNLSWVVSIFQMFGSVAAWAGDTVCTAFSLAWQLIGFVVNSAMDIIINGVANIAIAFTGLYRDIKTFFANIPSLAMIAFRTIGNLVGGIFDNIINGNFGGIGDTIRETMAQAGKDIDSETKKYDHVHMLNMLPDDKDLKRFTDGIANTDTSMISDAIDRAKAGMSELDKKPATKPPPGPAEIKLGKEKKAIKELSDIYAAGSSDAYAMAAKANVFFAGVVSPVASAPAMPETIGIDAGNSDSGDLAGRSDYKLDLMAARLTSIDNTLAKMGVA